MRVPAVPCVCAMLMALSCFAEERGVPVEGSWLFSNGAEFPGARGAIDTNTDGVVRISYDFSQGGNYVAAYCALGGSRAIGSASLRLCKPDGVPIVLRVEDSAGQSFQKYLECDLYAREQVCSFDMEDWTSHWGGANDGMLRPPLKTIGIIVDNAHLDESAGEVVVSDFRVVEGVPEAFPDTAFNGEYLVTDFGEEAGFHCRRNGSLHGGVLEADFAATDAVCLFHSISLFGKPSELRLVVKGGAPGLELAVSISSHFQTFEKVIGTLDGVEKTFSFAPPPEGWNHSGADEKSISYPLRITSVRVGRGAAPAARTSVVLSSLSCITEIKRDRAVSILAGLGETGVSGDTRNFKASCKAWNTLDSDVSGTLSMTLRDWERNVLAERSQAWTLPARGRPASVSEDVSIPAVLNFADVEFEFKADGIRKTLSRAAYAKPLDGEGDATLHPESPWGMGVYLYRYGHHPAGHAEMDRAAALAQAAGVKWSREEFSWASMEPSKGAIDFSFYDVVVDTARRHGISVYGLLGYWSGWTKPYTDEGIDDFAQWARATVRHFKDRVKHWEIYNEPNIFFWNGPKELYPVLVKKCYAAIKEEDPEAEVLAVSSAGIDRKFIKEVVDSGAPFDAVTVHPYRQRLADKGLMNELRATAELAGGRPVWITEMGWSTNVGGVDERKQAQLLARSYLSAVSSGACRNMGWYDFRDDGTDPFYFESNFGVMRRDFTPKPAYRALAAVCRNLASGVPEAGNFFEDKGVFALRMGCVTAVWTAESDATIEIAAGSGDVTAQNLMGEEIALGGGKKPWEISLRGGCPVFVRGGEVQIHRIEKMP